MLCPSCGQQNQQNARFCNTCGMRLSQGGLGGNMPGVQAPFPTKNTSPAGPGWQPPTPVNPQPMVPQPPAKQSAQTYEQDGIEGFVQDIQRRTEQSSSFVGAKQGSYQQTVQILEFQLEQLDNQGNRVRIVPVEMRGRSIVGFISNGHRVRVFGKMEHGLLRSRQIDDLTSHVTVQPRGLSLPMKIYTVVFLIAFLIFAIFILTNFAHGFSHPQIPFSPSATPDEVVKTYCSDILSGAYSQAYDQYSTNLMSQVSSAQLAQMWSDKHIDSCGPGAVQVSGNQANTTLSTHGFFTHAIENYSVVLIQDNNGGWKIDQLQLQQ